MKKILLIAAFLSCVFAACKKVDSDTVPGSKAMVLAYPATTSFNNAGSGLNFFDNQVLNLNLSDIADTVTLSANIGTASDKALTVTIAVDASAFSTYDAAPLEKVKYAPLPDSTYSIVNKTVTIPTGQTSALFKIAFKPSLINISDTGYLLPVTVTNTSGYALNNGMKTVYLHLNRNPLRLCNKALFKTIVLPNDVPSYGAPSLTYGIQNLWDGLTAASGGTIWSADGNHALPLSISFDMGATYPNLTQVTEIGRSNASGSNPTQMEVWGIADTTNAVPTLISQDPGWPTAMTAKGWTLLGTMVRSDSGGDPYAPPFTFNLNSGVPPVRFIRLRIISTGLSASGGPYANMTQVSFWYLPK